MNIHDDDIGDEESFKSLKDFMETHKEHKQLDTASKSMDEMLITDAALAEGDTTLHADVGVEHLGSFTQDDDGGVGANLSSEVG